MDTRDFKKVSNMKLSSYSLKPFLVLVVFFSFILRAQDCYESSVTSPTPFMGMNDEIFKLNDGSVWQVKYEYEYLYEYYPNVIICPSKNELIIGDKTLSVQQISSAKRSNTSSSSIESRIDGEFEGFEGETIFKLVNGQVWQQSEYWYHYHYSYMPKVIIYKSSYGYKIKVDGIEKSIGVVRLR